MNTWIKRVMSLLLCICLLLGNAMPALAAEEEDGEFALAVLTADGFVVEPTYIPYEAGEIIAQALLDSNFEFSGLENGWIQEVEGVSDSYSLFYDDNGYDLTVPADSITALCIITKAENGSAEYLALIKSMADFNASTNGVQEYSAALEAYEAAEKEIYAASAARAGELQRALANEMEDYEKFSSGELVTLTLDVDGVSSGLLIGQFGNTYEVNGKSEILVAPGEYVFDLSDGGRNHVRGSIAVETDTTLTATLPEGQWLDSMELSIANGGDWEAVSKIDDWTFAVPDYSGQHLYPYFVPAEDVDTASCAMYLGDGSKRVWRSHETVLARVTEPNSMEGTTLTLEARQAYGGYEQYQTYPIEIIRVPSLSDLTVCSDGTKLPLRFESAVMEYDLTTTGDSVDITPTVRNGGSTIAVNGEAVSGGSANVVLEEGINKIELSVGHENGQSRTYTLNVEKLSSVDVYVDTEADSVEVFNEAGASIAPVDGAYALVPGETYTYITTTDEFYHTSAEFTASQDLMVYAPEPETRDALSSLKVASALKAEPFEVNADFSADVHTYTYQVGSNETNFGIMAVLDDGYSDYAMTAHYDDYRTWNASYAGEKTTTISGPFRPAANFLGVSGIGNVLTLRISKEFEGVTFYQDYILTAQRKLQLNAVSISSNGQALVLNQEDGTAGFSKFVLDYTAQIGQTLSELQMNTKLFGSAAGNDNAVKVTLQSGAWSQVLDYAELIVDEVQTVTIPLDAEADGETIEVTLEREGATAQTYTVALEKLPPVETTITVDPVEALVYLTDGVTGARILPQNGGEYILDTGRTYTYVATEYGYQSTTGSFVAGADAQITIALTKAPENTLKDICVDTDYLSFRGNENNNGITDAFTPITAEDAVLNWANKIGEGTSGGGVGSPIIVGGDLYTYAGSTVFRMDKETGKILASTAMDHASSFSITPPAYGEGMLFVALANGGVQAFNAETLESLWVYADELSGQPNCPVIYQDGYIYTGFWNAEEKQANYVCICVTDEDPSRPDETKLAAWTYTHNGFYWAGAYVADDYLLVTTDDGSNGYTSAYGSILSIDPKTGLLLDSLNMPGVGDLRSSVCYDGETNACYFTSKGGDFYAIEVNADGTFRDNSLKQLHLTNGSDSEKNPPMSTSTPVVYHGRAYIGVSGTGQFVSYSGHNITVIDLKNWKIAYTVPTQGYPQTSGLLTTAYEGDTEYVYVYFLDNYTPGKLRVIRDTAGQNTFDTSYSTTETYTKSGKTYNIETGYVLFTPSSAQAQYAICSPIVDEYGNLYFKNDSGYLMCLGSTIKEVLIEQEPEKTDYEVGQVFDGTGLKVTAVYANGIVKDVTEYVTYSMDPLTADDTEFTVRVDLGEHQMMYQNKDGEAGVEYYVPSATIDLTIYTDHTWNKGTQTKAPTCAQPGEMSFTCMVCGDTKTEPVPATGNHSWNAGVVTTQPTGTKDGVKTYTCNACGGKKTEPVPATGEHIWDEGKVTKAATCTVNGVKTYTCQECGETRNVEIPATGSHSWDSGKVTKEASVIAAGEKGFTCTVCGGEKTEMIPQLDPCDGGSSCVGKTFTDWVPAKNWAHAGMDYAVSRGLMNGVGGGKFDPNGELNRAMLVTILWRYAGSEDVGYSDFADVPQNSWYAKSVAWAAKYGIVNGMGNNKFAPKEPITREQIATILYRYAGYLKLDTPTTGDFSKFEDGPEVSRWAKDAMQWATAAGVLNGSAYNGKLYLNPGDNATRAQTAKLIMSYIELILK